MRSAIWSGFLAAIVCAVTVGLVAQAPPSSPASQSGKQVTFSGCIEKAPAEAGASAATATPAFILANASPAASGSASHRHRARHPARSGHRAARNPPRSIDWMRTLRNSPRMWVTRSRSPARLKKCRHATSPSARPLRDGARPRLQARLVRSSRSSPSRWSRLPVRSVVITTVWCAGLVPAHQPSLRQTPSSVTPLTHATQTISNGSGAMSYR